MAAVVVAGGLGAVVERRHISRCFSVAASVALWAAFVVQIFVGQFLNYRPRTGWLIQPLVQAPWFRHIPAVGPQP